MDQLGVWELVFCTIVIAWIFIAQALVMLAVRRFEESQRSEQEMRRDRAEVEARKKKAAFHFGGRPPL